MIRKPVPKNGLYISVSGNCAHFIRYENDKKIPVGSQKICYYGTTHTVNYVDIFNLPTCSGKNYCGPGVRLNPYYGQIFEAILHCDPLEKWIKEREEVPVSKFIQKAYELKKECGDWGTPEHWACFPSPGGPMYCAPATSDDKMAIAEWAANHY